MKKLLQLVMSSGFAAVLQLLANTMLFWSYDELSYTQFTQILLLSATLRPLFTLKFENSIFRVHNALFITYCLLFLSLVVTLLLFYIGSLQNNSMLIMSASICFVVAANELAELILIKLDHLSKIVIIRMMRPLSLIALVFGVSSLHLDFSIITIFMLSYLPSQILIFAYFYSRRLFPKGANLGDFAIFVANEKNLSLYSVPAGILYGSSQYVIFGAVINNTDAEFSALVGFTTRILESIINIIIPNLRSFLLKFTKIQPGSLKRIFLLFLSFAVFVGLVQLFWTGQEVVLIGMFYLLISRLMITFFNSYAYVKRQDYFVLVDALVCFLTLRLFLISGVEIQWIYAGYLSTFIVCSVMLLRWKVDVNEK